MSQLSHVLRYRLLEILRANPPRNTCQICRIVNDSKPYDIVKCRGSKARPIIEFGKDSYFRVQGPYPNCKDCNVIYTKVYRELFKLERKGFVETRKEWRSDPIKPNAKDNVRMWALKGKLPSLKHFT